MKYFVLLILATISIRVFSQPVIASFTPLSAAPGASVTIIGSNFNASPTNNIVFFGAVRATVSSATSTSIVAIVPYGATHDFITVTTGNLVAYSPRKFFTATGTDVMFTPGSFGPGQDLVADDYVFSIAVADFDGDGKTDVATGNYSSTTVSVFKNRSNPKNIILDTRINLVTAQKPGDIKAGDIDGDGKPDLVTANDASKTISVFRNTSTTTTISFATKQDFTTGTYAVGICIGDIDGDGKADIIETNNQDNSVSVFRNTSSAGSISFAPRINFNTTSSPQNVRLADMDGDGKPEIIVVNFYGNSVSVFTNNSVPGTISLNAKIDFPTDGHPNSIDIGDFDDDGKADIVTGNLQYNTISVLHNTSAVTGFSFERLDIIVGTSPGYVAINDLDGDGKPDIAVGGSELNIAVLKNTSASSIISFAPKETYYITGSSRAIATADLDNDGKNDILAGYSSKVAIFRNRIFEPDVASFSPTSGSEGTLVTIKGLGFTAATSVRFGNLPAASFTIVNDSTIIATVGYGAYGYVTVLNAFGTSVNTSIFNYFAVPPIITSVTPGSGDVGTIITIKGKRFGTAPANRIIYFGAVKAPLISVNDSVITVRVPKGATYDAISVTKEKLTAYADKPFNVTFAGSNGMFSQNTFGNTIDSAAGSAPAGIATGDFDGDGKPDIVVANSNASSISVHRNTSDSTKIAFARKVDFVTGNNPEGVAVADMDGDGRLDIAVANTGSGTVSFYRNTSTLNSINFSGRFDVATPSMPSSIKLGDLNADGRPDAAVLCKTGVLTTLRNTSGDSFIYYSLRIDSTVNVPAKDLVIADLDGDGKPDVAVSDSSSGYVTVFRNTSTSSGIGYAARQRFASGYNGGIAASDMDGDGKTDLVITNISGNITVLKNESSVGALSFNNHSFGTAASGLFLTVADIDGDGKPDVGHTSRFTPDVSIIRNASAASIAFDSNKKVTMGNAPQGIAFADLDGDSKPELITALKGNDKIAISRNQTGEIIKIIVCPGGSTSIASNIEGGSYQWQVDTGTGYVNIPDTGNYSGTSTSILQLTSVPSSWYGYKFRAIVAGTSSDEYSLKFENRWIGTSGTWESAASWNCGSLPDENTDVVISSGTVTLNSNVSIRKLVLNAGVTVNVTSGFTLTITH